MNRVTKLRNTERARNRRMAAAGLRWQPGLRAPIRRVSSRPAEPSAAAADGRTDVPLAASIVASLATSRAAADHGGPIRQPRHDELEHQILLRAGARSHRVDASSFASFFLALALAIGVSGAGFDRACAQVTWLNTEDGEILNVSSADGPPPGRPFMQMRRSIERSTLRGTMVLSRLRALYGVTPNVTAGVSALHLQQQLGDLEKRGLGDTNLSLKIHYAPWPDQPIRFGLRQTLSIPTGYEKEMDGLAPFTSRQNDYSAQLLAQYVTPGFAAYANPGVQLPGGKADSYLTGGLGLAMRLPLGFDLRGEYYTRWDIVTRQFESETYLGMRRHLAFGIGVQAGMKRRLLQDETVDPEFQLGLTLGRDRTQAGQLYAFRERADTGLLVHSVQTAIPDPFGLGREFSESFRSEPVGGRTQPAVYVASVREDAPATGGIAISRASEWVTTLSTPRNYELNVKILGMRDAEVGGLDLSPVFRVSRARTTVVGQCELIAPDGYSVLTRKLYQGTAAKLLGVQLAPESGSLAASQAPDEVRNRLRRDAVRDLMRQVRDDAIQTIQMRDYR